MFLLLTLKDAYKSDLRYVNRIYTIKIQAKNSTETYGPYATYKLTILPQTMSNIAITVYNFTSANGNESYVQSEPPVSVIKPSDTALMVIDLFPSFATFDYVEITATSNTLAKLSYRIQKRQGNSYKYDSLAEVEALPNVNGIKIYNNFNGEVLDQYIGSYYVMIFADNTHSQDAIFTINVNAYYNGEKLEKSATFSLFVKEPPKPEITVDGKNSLYAYPTEEINAIVRISSDQSITAIELLDSSNNKNDFKYSLEKLTEQPDAEYISYSLKFQVPYMEIKENTKTLYLWVKSYKIDRGEVINLKDDLVIHLVNFKAPANSILINGEIDNLFKVTSVKYLSLELFTNLLYGVDEDGTNQIVEEFKNKYWVNNDCGFTFGKMAETSQAEALMERAYTLASYLYYVEGNTFSPILNVSTNDDEIVYKFANGSYSKVIQFTIKEVVDEKGEIIDYVLLLNLYFLVPNYPIPNAILP